LTEFDGNGRKQNLLRVLDGKITDHTQWWWHNNGQMREEQIYRDGTMVSDTVWSPDGEKTSEYLNPN
jgi:hypothetical protein